MPLVGLAVTVMVRSRGTFSTTAASIFAVGSTS